PSRYGLASAGMFRPAARWPCSKGSGRNSCWRLSGFRSCVLRRRALRKPRAFSQRILEVDGNTVLLEQVRKGFVGQFLKCRHPVTCKLGELVQRVIVEGDQFAQARPTPGVERM